jgi:hypothetical protein
MGNSSNHAIGELLKTVSKIEANEVRATLGAFLLLVILMSAYYILRPVRDGYAVSRCILPGWYRGFTPFSQPALCCFIAPRRYRRIAA